MTPILSRPGRVSTTVYMYLLLILLDLDRHAATCRRRCAANSRLSHLIASVAVFEAARTEPMDDRKRDLAAEEIRYPVNCSRPRSQVESLDPGELSAGAA